MIKIKAILFDGMNIEQLMVNVNEKNYILVKKKLESEHLKIVNKLKEYKKAGIIKSIYAPSNKKIKDHLKELVLAKRIIKQSVSTLRQFYK